MLERVVGTGVCGCVYGTMNGMFNWRKVSCMQKFAFATLATLIAISMLATHIWRTNVGLLPSISNFLTGNDDGDEGGRSALFLGAF